MRGWTLRPGVERSGLRQYQLWLAASRGDAASALPLPVLPPLVDGELAARLFVRERKPALPDNRSCGGDITACLQLAWRWVSMLSVIGHCKSGANGRTGKKKLSRDDERVWQTARPRGSQPSLSAIVWTGFFVLHCCSFSDLGPQKCISVMGCTCQRCLHFTALNGFLIHPLIFLWPKSYREVDLAKFNFNVKLSSR